MPGFVLFTFIRFVLFVLFLLQPSSSGRSAELLGSSVPQFIGFSGLKDTALGISLTTKDELEAALDPNIQLILKKISKKDATTKIKVLVYCVILHYF